MFISVNSAHQIEGKALNRVRSLCNLSNTRSFYLQSSALTEMKKVALITGANR